MSESTEQRAKSIFLAAREKPPEHRSAFLDQMCGEAPELRARVLALLDADAAADSGFLESPASVPGSGTDDVPGGTAVNIGGRIGPYKLLEQIGEGGFGYVYMAEQEKPVRRRVALKVLKPGMDSAEILARFEAERQALAMMSHPNIAGIVDAGTTPGGRPFFVMELVRGEPITDFCDGARLDTAARLGLFRDVCLAVQHAHLKGIIHRDIKPTNVLVTRRDGQPVVKVIDFGIAKALEVKLTEQTFFTEFAQIVGTPEYMSPEQAAMNAADIDARADVYSLGVLLYELLTGSKPFDLRTLLEQGYQEIFRFIREETPPKPSTRVSSLGEASASVGVTRHSTPKLLGRLFRGELDWIVMKALEKDRDRRYDGAGRFAEDVERYLANRPVEAVAPSRLYLARKFARRHRTGVAAATAVVMALIVGLVVAGIGWREAGRQRDDARRARDAAQTAEVEARDSEQEALAARAREEDARRRAEAGERAAKAESQRAESVLDILREALVQALPGHERGPNYPLRGFLADVEAVVEGEEAEYSEVELSVRWILGRGFEALGLADRARRHLERRLALAEEVHGSDGPEFADALADTARLDPETADQRLRRAMALHESAGSDPARIAELRSMLGEQISLRDPAAGLALLSEVDRWQEEHLRPGDPDRAVTLARMAETLRRMGRIEEALDAWSRARDSEAPGLGGSTAINMASMLIELDRADEAIAICREEVRRFDRRFGTTHPLAAGARIRLGEALAARGDDEADRWIAEAIEGARLLYGRDGPEMALFHLIEARREIGAGRYERALAVADRALELTVHAEQRALLHGYRKHALASLGRSDEVEASLRAAVADAEATENPVLRAVCLTNLAKFLASSGHQTEAREALLLVIESLDDADRGHWKYLAEAESSLGFVLLVSGRADEGARRIERAVDLLRRGELRGETAGNVLRIASQLETVRGNTAASLELLEEARGQIAHAAESNPIRLMVEVELVRDRVALGRVAEAKAGLDDLLSRVRRHMSGTQVFGLAFTVAAQVRLAEQDPDGAIALLEEAIGSPLHLPDPLFLLEHLYEQAGRWADRIDVLEKLAGWFEATEGAGSPSRTEARRRMADSAIELRELERAVTHAEAAWSSAEVSALPAEAKLACLRTFALARHLAGDLETADELLGRGGELAKAVPGGWRSEQVALYRQEVAEMHFRRGRHAALDRRVEETRKELAPLGEPGRFLLVGFLRWQTESRLARNEAPGAMELVSEARGIVESAGDPNHPQALLLESTAGAVLLALGRHEEAETALVRAYEGLAGVSPAYGPVREEARGRLVALCEAQGRTAEAKRWREAPAR